MAIAHPRVDHVEDAARVYRSLGFHLTERSRHTRGFINHLAVFESDYLELLGFDAAGGAVRAYIAQFPAGLNGLVFATPSADSLFQELKSRHVPVQEPVVVSRPVVLTDGSHDASFRAVRLQAGAASFGHDTLRVQLGDAMPLPSGRSDFIARLGIRTASLSAASQALRSGDIPFTHPDPGRILVSAGAASNVAIEFSE